jgi:hypothetical protein
MNSAEVERVISKFCDPYGHASLYEYFNSWFFRRDFLASITFDSQVQGDGSGVKYKPEITYVHDMNYDNFPTVVPADGTFRDIPRQYATFTFSPTSFSDVLPYTVGSKTRLALTTTYPTFDTNGYPLVQSSQIQSIDLGEIELEVMETF